MCYIVSVLRWFLGSFGGGYTFLEYTLNVVLISSGGAISGDKSRVIVHWSLIHVHRL